MRNQKLPANSNRLDSFVDDPQPDETVYSLISRFHILSGNPNMVATLTELYSGSCRRMSLGPLGFKLVELSARVPSGSAFADFRYLARHHTSLPYHLCFFSEDEERLVSETIREKGMGALHVRLGLPQSLNRPGRCRHQGAILSGSDGGVYEWQAVHGGIQARGGAAGR